MAKQENNKIGLGEISTIRDILMGTQIAEFQGKFDDADNRIDTLQKWVEERLDKMEEGILARLDAIEEKTNQRLEVVTNTIQERTTELEGKVKNSSTSDKELLGQMLQEMSAKLLNGK